MRTEACRATAGRGEQSQALLDLRMGCLDRRAGQLRALTGALAGTGDLDRSLGAVARLEPLSSCADAEALTQAYPPPGDPAQRARVAAARQGIDEATALELTYKLPAAAEKIKPIVVEAQAVGYPPLVAEALYRQTSIQTSIDMGASAGDAGFVEVIPLAARSRDARLETRAWVSLLRTRLHRGHHDEALALAVGARAALERAGHPPDLELLVGQSIGFALTEAGRLDQAVAQLEETLARAADASPLLLASLLNDLGVALREAGRLRDSTQILERARLLYAERVGPESIPVAGTLINLGETGKRAGDYAAARVALERALALMEKNTGPDNPQVAMVLTNLSAVSHALGDVAAAEAQARRSLAIKEQAWGPDNVRLATSLGNLSQALIAAGRAGEARGHADRMVQLVEKARGPRHVAVAEALLFAADAALAAGRAADAERAVDRALSILAENRAPDDRGQLYSAIEVLLARGRFVDALALVERAAAVKGADPLDAARIDFLRAAAAWGANRDRPAALAAARAVEARLAAGTAMRARVATWVAAHR
jgi:eukaryotic-like serine/threonine-protein kinase